MSKVNKKRRAKTKKQKRSAVAPSVEATVVAAANEKITARKPETETIAEAVGGAASVDQTEQQSGLVLYDESLLDICRTRWQFADWAGLASINAEHIRYHPQRGKIALLIAAAHWQLDQAQQAHRFIQMALDCGVSERQLVQILMSGIHQGLAEAHAILDQSEDAHDHCLEAIDTAGVPGDTELLAKIRMQRMQHNELRENQWER